MRNKRRAARSVSPPPSGGRTPHGGGLGGAFNVRQGQSRRPAAVLAALALAGTLAGQPARAADPAAAAAPALSPPPPPRSSPPPSPRSSSPATSAAADRCLAAADEAALLACRSSVHADASRALDQAVDKLQQRWRDDAPEHLKLFNAAQQTWRHYRQAECRFRLRESVGGAAYPASLLSCATELNLQRLQALQTVINRP